MTSTFFPTVATWPLPAVSLRTPLPAREADKPAQLSAGSDDRTDDDLARQVSDAIARRVRQRRYTG